MNYTLKSDMLEVVISDFGAEIQSIKQSDNGTEFIWQGDESIWNGRSPLLFPIVGRLIDDKLKIDGQEYSMPKHGFARNNVFTINHLSENSLVLELTNNEEIDKMYPYKFVLKVAYNLTNDTLKVSYSVKNNDYKDICFSIGAHPAFNCQLGDYIEFEKSESVETYLMNSSGYLYAKELLLDNYNKIILKSDTFKKDAIMLDSLKSTYVTLKMKDYSIKVVYFDAPYLAFWSKPLAPFVCIEPWYGLNDWQGLECDFKNKFGVISLGVENIFNYAYTIQIE